MGTTNGASDTTMADIGRNAGKMECVRALTSEYSLTWTVALASNSKDLNILHTNSANK